MHMLPKTMAALLPLLLANLAGAITLESGLKYGFSECVDYTRTLFYYSDEEATCSTHDAKKVIAKRTWGT